MMRVPTAVLAALITGVSVGAAQQPIDQTVPSSPTGEVEITNVAGQVRVSGWDRSEILIRGTLGRGSERLAVEGGRERTTIRVIVPRSGRNVQGTELEVRVPAGKNVRVRTTSATIRIEGVTGALNAVSTSGDVSMAGSPRDVVAESTSGQVQVRATTRSIRTGTTSGDINLTGMVREAVTARSVSGSVATTAATPELTAQTVSGDLQVSGVDRRVTASTVSGSTSVRGGRLQYASLESVSGDVHLDGDLQRGGTVNIESHSGSVNLILPAKLAATFHINTFSGDIQSQFGPQTRTERRHGPGEELRFSTGEGGLVTVQTFSGSVNLRRR